MAVFAGSSFASPAVAPSIKGESVSQITSTGATLEATIDPGSAAAGAYYQFQLAEDPGEFAGEIECPPPPSSGPFLPCIGTESATALPIGHISHGAGEATVTLDLAKAGVTLKPGTTYHYRVLAAPAKQSEDTIEWEEPTIFGATQSFASSSPAITAESVSDITGSDATLEAQIDSGSAMAGARYQFQIAESPGELAGEILCPPPSGPIACIGNESVEALPIGFIAHQAGSSLVSLDLASAGVVLQPGKTYYYRVLAASSKATEDTIEWEEPTIFGATQSFMTSTCPSTSGSGSSGGSTSGSSAGSGSVSPSPMPPRRHHHRRHHRHRVGAPSSVALAAAVRVL